MMTYRVDRPFVILTTTGVTTAAEGQAVYARIRSDPSVPDGAFFIIDIRKNEFQLTQVELQNRVQAFVEGVGPKFGNACAVVVSETSLPVGLSFRMVAANMNVRVGVFRDEAGARSWLMPSHGYGET